MEPLGWRREIEGTMSNRRHNVLKDKKLVLFKRFFFPRASERRVLLIVGVCQTFSHLHIFTSSHPHIFTSSHLHILTSSHLQILTSSHLHITSSHLLIFTSHLLIFTSSHSLLPSSSSHLHIFTSYLHIFTFSHLHILTSSHSLLLSCPLALSFFSISLLRRGAVPTRRHETQPFRTKRCSIAKNWGKVAICKASGATFRTKWGSIAKNWSKVAICKSDGEPFRTKWGSIAKNWGKIAISGFPLQPFRTKWSSIAKNGGKIAILICACPSATLSHKMVFDRQKLKPSTSQARPHPKHQPTATRSVEEANPREEAPLGQCTAITGNTMPLGKVRFPACPRPTSSKGQATFRGTAYKREHTNRPATRAAAQNTI